MPFLRRRPVSPSGLPRTPPKEKSRAALRIFVTLLIQSSRNLQNQRAELLFAVARSEDLLIVADSEHDANMLYAVGMFVPDPFIYFRVRGRHYVVMSDLEIDRARKQAPHCLVLSLSHYQKRLRERGIKNPSLANVVGEIFRLRKVRRVTVPPNFPHGMAIDLQRAGVRIKAAAQGVFPQR